MPRAKLLINRLAYIQERCRGKTVLDVGGAGTEGRPYQIPKDVIIPVAKRYTGLDLQKTNDPRIVQGNAETKNLHKTFDVIVAGDIIEHVTNQGLFLKNMQRHMRSDSTLIITTPNVRSRWIISPVNPEHTLWHDKWTLQHILEREHLTIIDFAYYFGNKPLSLPLEIYRNLIYRMFHSLAEGMLVVVKKKH